jgi:hypothetical protein
MLGVVVISLIAVVVLALVLLSWWWSGRSSGTDNGPLAAAERSEAESRSTKEYRPSGGFGP